jgi:DNA-directed RNA polymerase beta subunit
MIQLYYKLIRKIKKLLKQKSLFAKIDKMKIKIPVYSLLRSLGISNKKIIYSIGIQENVQNLNIVKNTKVYDSLTEIAELLFEKEKNIMR